MNTLTQRLPATAAAEPRGQNARSWPWMWTLLVLVALLLGWSARGQRYLTAESGIGYALGIVGGLMMLVLLAYPLRKRLRALGRWGSVRHWFRVHVVLGVLGPVLILYHANFELGSLNSSVALFSMLTVAVSGLIGRYLYERVGSTLYESRTRLQEMQSDTRRLLRALDPLLKGVPELRASLDRYTDAALALERGRLRDLPLLFTLGNRTRRARGKAKRIATEANLFIGKQQGWSQSLLSKQIASSRRDLNAYFEAAMRTGEFGYYMRMFALWHQLHLPLFIMLIVTGVTHVVAVHWY